MRVICVKWGDKYGPEWVYRLRQMVARNLSIEHDFVCITDRPIPDVQCFPCVENLPTWWSKLSLFATNFPGLNLYLDLDVVITGSIDKMVQENQSPGYVHAPDDFSYSLLHPKQGLGEHMQRLLGGKGTINSSVMLWRDDAGREAWDDFTRDKMDEVHGDQNWITQALWPEKLRLLTPGHVCSYKYHVQRGEKAAPIVVFHGEPKITGLPKNSELYRAWVA